MLKRFLPLGRCFVCAHMESIVPTAALNPEPPPEPPPRPLRHTR